MLAAGIYEDGASARARALAGAVAASTDGALDALASNPAGLADIRGPKLEVGGNYGWAHGTFSNRANDRTILNEHGATPGLGLAYPVGPITFGLGVIQDSGLRADWRFRDAPGGLDGATSYGFRAQKSEIAVVRIALGASYQITPTFSAGATLGVLYNRNRLDSPYTIQTQSQLAGAKTLLDLETEGWGVNAEFGLLWKPLANLQLGLSYTLQSRIKTTGRAFADARRQLENLGVTGVNTTGTFDAEVTNTFPQILSAGAAWQVTPRLNLLAQVDWINWASSFDTLEVRLRNVDNPLYRQLMAGKSNLDDDVRLDWRNQWVARFGLEYRVTETWTLRAGYRYGQNPVPAETLTPTNAATNEHLLTAGIGYHTGPLRIDLAYQWGLPQHEHVEHSRLVGGEYAESDLTVGSHQLSLTVGYEF